MKITHILIYKADGGIHAAINKDNNNNVVVWRFETPIYPLNVTSDFLAEVTKVHTKIKLSALGYEQMLKVSATFGLSVIENNGLIEEMLLS